MKIEITKHDGAKVVVQNVTVDDVLARLRDEEIAILHATSARAEVIVFKDAGYGVTVGVETDTEEMRFSEFGGPEKDRAFDLAIRAL